MQTYISVNKLSVVICLYNIDYDKKNHQNDSWKNIFKIDHLGNKCTYITIFSIVNSTFKKCLIVRVPYRGKWSLINAFYSCDSIIVLIYTFLATRFWNSNHLVIHEMIFLFFAHIVILGNVELKKKYKIASIANNCFWKHQIWILAMYYISTEMHYTQCSEPPSVSMWLTAVSSPDVLQRKQNRISESNQLDGGQLTETVP